MASDYILDLGDLKGESKDSKFPGCIDVDSFSWGVSNPTSFGAGGGGGTGKASFQDIHFTKSVCKASPLLFLRCASGEHKSGKDAVLHVRKAGKEQQEFYTLTLKEFAVSSFQSGGHSGGGIMESFSIGFTQINFEYKEQKPDGTLGPKAEGGWNVSTNKQS